MEVHEILDCDLLLFDIEPQTKCAQKSLYDHYKARYHAVKGRNNQIDGHKNPYNRVDYLDRVENIADRLYSPEIFFYLVKLVVGLRIEET